MRTSVLPALLALVPQARAPRASQEGLGQRLETVRADRRGRPAAATQAVEGHIARLEPLEAAESSPEYLTRRSPSSRLAPPRSPRWWPPWPLPPRSPSAAPVSLGSVT